MQARNCLFLAAAAALLAAVATAAPPSSIFPSSSSSSSGGSSSANGASGPCPPPNFANVMRTLSLPAYIIAPWYVQKQIPLDYQPADETYCVRAEYEPMDPRNISAGLVVNNYANKGGVNGPTVGSSKYDRSNSSSSRLIAMAATFKARGHDGKLLVGPEILMRVLPPGAWRSAFGPYWVVAVGYSQNTTLKYSWAIVSGGAPEIASPAGNGCTTIPYKNSTAPTPAGGPAAAGAPTSSSPTSSSSSSGWPTGTAGGAPQSGGWPTGGGGSGAPSFASAAVFDKGGLWFLTRKPVDPVLVAKMEVRAKALGLDTSQMVPVPQQGCLYRA